MANTESFLSGLSKSLSNGIDESSKIKMQLALQSQHIQMQQDAEFARQNALQKSEYALKDANAKSESLRNLVQPKDAENIALSFGAEPERAKSLSNLMTPVDKQTFYTGLAALLKPEKESPLHFLATEDDNGVKSYTPVNKLTGEIAGKPIPAGFAPKAAADIATSRKNFGELHNILGILDSRVNTFITAKNVAELPAQMVGKKLDSLIQDNPKIKAYLDQLPQDVIRFEKLVTNNGRMPTELVNAAKKGFYSLNDTVGSLVEKRTGLNQLVNGLYGSTLQSYGLDPTKDELYKKYSGGYGMGMDAANGSADSSGHKPASQKAKDYLKTLGY